MRVLLGHAAVRRPAGVAKTGGRLRPVRPGLLLQVREIADGADVVEAVGREQGDAGRVVPAVLQPLEALE